MGSMAQCFAKDNRRLTIGDTLPTLRDVIRKHYACG